MGPLSLLVVAAAGAGGNDSVVWCDGGCAAVALGRHLFRHDGIAVYWHW